MIEFLQFAASRCITSNPPSDSRIYGTGPGTTLIMVVLSRSKAAPTSIAGVFGPHGAPDTDSRQRSVGVAGDCDGVGSGVGTVVGLNEWARMPRRGKALANPPRTWPWRRSPLANETFSTAVRLRRRSPPFERGQALEVS